MKIPVMLEVSPEETFDASAMARLQESAIRATPEGAILQALEVDRILPPVPVPPELEAASSGTAPATKRASSFAIAGTIEVGSASEIPERLDGRRVLADPQIDTYATCLGDAAIGTAQEVSEQLQFAALQEAGFDGEGVAIAIVDEGLNINYLEEKLGFRPKIDLQYSWRPHGITLEPGDYPIGHGTMCAYAALLAAPKATLIDVPALVGVPVGGSRFGKRLSIANMAISQLASFWSIAFTTSGERKFKGLIVSNSYGLYHPSWDFPAGHPGRYSDNPNHVFTWNVSGLSLHGRVDFVFAAGNCGDACPDDKCQGVVDASITGANASANVLTIGGCTLHGERAGYSSSGPAIAGMSERKPDLLSFTHYRGSEALGPLTPDKGTSASCPLAAGCLAALRTKVSPDGVSPAALKDILLNTARSDHAGTWDRERGFGIIDPVAAADALGYTVGS